MGERVVKCERCLDYGYISWWDTEGSHKQPCTCEAGQRFRRKQKASEVPTDDTHTRR